MAGFRDELRVLFRAPLAPVIWFLASILTLVTGPFGTYDTMSLAMRSVFWPCMIAAGLVAAYVLCALFTVLFPRMNVWLHDIAVAVLISVLFTPVVPFALTVAASDDSLVHAHLAEMITISVCVAILQRLVKLNWPQLTVESGAAPKPATPTSPEPRLLRRLDGVRAAEVLRLTAEDHYVEVVLSDRPSQRVLMRFADAVDEIAGLEGLYVHRSHWVVRAHIVGVMTDNGRDMVALTDGSRVPVSRTYRANLEPIGVRYLERDKAAG